MRGGWSVSATNPDPLTDPTYIHSFEDHGNSDMTLTLTSDHGCTDTLIRTDAVFLNGYEAEIAAAPDSICFDGAETTTQEFSATINARFIRFTIMM